MQLSVSIDDAVISNAIAALVDTNNRLARIESKLDQLTTNVGVLMADEKQVVDALTAIDGATTAIATNVQKIADTNTQIATVAGTISTEMDTLLAQLQAAGVPQSLVDQAAALQGKVGTLQTSADAAATALAAQVPVLQAIASKGSSNPVPVDVPPPPAPPPPTGA